MRSIRFLLEHQPQHAMLDGHSLPLLCSSSVFVVRCLKKRLKMIHAWKLLLQRRKNPRELDPEFSGLSASLILECSMPYKLPHKNLRILSVGLLKASFSKNCSWTESQWFQVKNLGRFGHDVHLRASTERNTWLLKCC